MSLIMIPEPTTIPDEQFYLLGLVHRILHFTKSATVTPGSIASLATYTTTITVTGTVAGQTVLIGPPAALQAGLVPFGVVTAANTVTLSIYNSTAGALTPASATWNVRVMA